VVGDHAQNNRERPQAVNVATRVAPREQLLSSQWALVPYIGDEGLFVWYCGADPGHEMEVAVCTT
jgi:hypothetical protein